MPGLSRPVRASPASSSPANGTCTRHDGIYSSTAVSPRLELLPPHRRTGHRAGPPSRIPTRRHDLYSSLDRPSHSARIRDSEFTTPYARSDAANNADTASWSSGSKPARAATRPAQRRARPRTRTVRVQRQVQGQQRTHRRRRLPHGHPLPRIPTRCHCTIPNAANDRGVSLNASAAHLHSWACQAYADPEEIKRS